VLSASFSRECNELDERKTSFLSKFTGTTRFTTTTPDSCPYWISRECRHRLLERLASQVSEQAVFQPALIVAILIRIPECCLSGRSKEDSLSLKRNPERCLRSLPKGEVGKLQVNYTGVTINEGIIMRPTIQSDSNKVLAFDRGDSAQSVALKHLHVLLVEDEPDVADLFTFVLEFEGAKVVLAGSALEA
jgi:CheY-like chemotaxis protein